MSFWSSTAKDCLCGLAFWFMHSPLSYGPKRKETILEVWNKEFQSLCDLTDFFGWDKLISRIGKNTSSCLVYSYHTAITAFSVKLNLPLNKIVHKKWCTTTNQCSRQGKYRKVWSLPITEQTLWTLCRGKDEESRKKLYLVQAMHLNFCSLQKYV